MDNNVKFGTLDSTEYFLAQFAPEFDSKSDVAELVIFLYKAYASAAGVYCDGIYIKEWLEDNGTLPYPDVYKDANNRLSKNNLDVFGTQAQANYFYNEMIRDELLEKSIKDVYQGIGKEDRCDWIVRAHYAISNGLDNNCDELISRLDEHLIAIMSTVGRVWEREIEEHIESLNRKDDSISLFDSISEIADALANDPDTLEVLHAYLNKGPLPKEEALKQITSILDRMSCIEAGEVIKTLNENLSLRQIKEDS